MILLPGYKSRAWYGFMADLVAAVNAALPSGTPAAYKLPWRDASNAFRWSTSTEVVARALGWKIADDYSLDTTGATTHTAAQVQAWLDAGVAYAAGTIKCSGTVVIKDSADLHLLTLNYTGTSGTALEVGVSGSPTYRKRVHLPKIIATAKTVTGWAQVAGTIGVEIKNCFNLDVTVPYIQSFETGLQFGGYSNGTSYCNVFLGHLDNNKRNERWTADATGWANQNCVYGGRMSHNSGEGTAVSGTRHILMELTSSKINNNVHYGTSLESPNTVEYHLDCAGNDNYWEDCRWENTGTGARVVWRANSVGNVIRNGFGAATIVETKESGTANHLLTRDRQRLVGNGAGTGHALLALENSLSGSAAALRVMDAGAESAGSDQTTAWCVQLSAQALKGKRSTDSDDRVRYDFVNGRIYVGNGSAATSRYFGNVGTSMGFDGANVVYVTDNTYDFGAATLRPRYGRFGTAVQVGAFATGSRPSASTAGAGAMVFDSTLNKPIWSDGTNWRDATGTTV